MFKDFPTEFVKSWYKWTTSTGSAKISTSPANRWTGSNTLERSKKGAVD